MTAVSLLEGTVTFTLYLRLYLCRYLYLFCKANSKLTMKKRITVVFCPFLDTPCCVLIVVFEDRFLCCVVLCCVLFCSLMRCLEEEMGVTFISTI
jgi:hypothetical protein